MLKSINKLTKDRLTKGGVGSGRYPKGSGGQEAKSIHEEPHKAIGVKKEDIHPSVRWAERAQVFPRISHTTDDLSDKGKRVWNYTLSNGKTGQFYQSQQYADKERAVNAMKNHLLTGRKNPISWYKP